MLVRRFLWYVRQYLLVGVFLYKSQYMYLFAWWCIIMNHLLFDVLVLLGGNSVTTATRTSGKTKGLMSRTMALHMHYKSLYFLWALFCKTATWNHYVLHIQDNTSPDSNLGGGGGVSGAKPLASRTSVSLCLLTSALYCVVPVFRLIKCWMEPRRTLNGSQKRCWVWVFDWVIISLSFPLPALIEIPLPALSSPVSCTPPTPLSPRGALPYMAYTGTCRWTGYGFWPLCPEQGIQFYANLS